MASTRRLPLARSADDRLLAGVAGGLGAAFGVDPIIVRLGFVVLTAAGGSGLALYLVGWLLLPSPGGGSLALAAARRRDDWDWVQAGALGAVVLGTLLLLRELGLWFADALVWPLAAGAVGVALVWSRSDPPDGASSRVPLRGLPPSAAAAVTALVGTRPGGMLRLGVGVVLLAGGIGGLLAATGAVSLGAALLASVVLLLGLALVAGPSLWRLSAALVEERRERIRSQERAELAAHLHDSVLQTLALIQRRAEDPRAVVRLARGQERELRAWLAGLPSPDGSQGAGTLATALEQTAAEVEQELGVPIELVRVGDAPLDDEALRALVAAGREAMVNAARHSGANRVSTYLEVEPGEAHLFVRDAGVGFDAASVPADRRGVRESIVGRLARHGGRAEIRSAPGEGTEVQLHVGRAPR